VTQRVVSDNPPYVPIRVTVEGDTEPIFIGEALVDTGYDGSLGIPSDFLTGHTPVGEWQIELADGSKQQVPYLFGSVEIVGLATVGVVMSVLGTEAILGRRVTDYFRVTFDHGVRSS
jgi:predicted aspartyl protease